MRDELARSGEGSLFITEPPLRVLEIEILDDAQEHECPCCLPDREADIVINAPEGITRDRFLSAVRDGLYGDGVGEEGSRMPMGGKYDGKLVVRGWDYMMQNGTQLYRGSSYSNMRIWMYCGGGG